MPRWLFSPFPFVPTAERPHLCVFYADDVADAQTSELRSAAAGSPLLFLSELNVSVLAVKNWQNYQSMFVDGPSGSKFHPQLILHCNFTNTHPEAAAFYCLSRQWSWHPAWLFFHSMFLLFLAQIMSLSWINAIRCNVWNSARWENKTTWKWMLGLSLQTQKVNSWKSR